MKTFQMTRLLRLGNRITSLLLGLGLPVGPMAMLNVKGRSSRIVRSTPVALTKDGEGWLLVAAYGRVDWAKNLEAAGEATLTRRRREVAVDSELIDSKEAAPILRRIVAAAGPITMRVIGPYFDASPDEPPEAWEAESVNHPLFRLTPKPGHVAFG